MEEKDFDVFQKRLDVHNLQDRINRLKEEIKEYEQKKLRAKLKRLPPHQKIVLSQLAYDREGFFVYCRTLSQLTKLEMGQVRRALRALCRLGFVELYPGLCDDDGLLRGSGYSCTEAGAHWYYNNEAPPSDLTEQEL